MFTENLNASMVQPAATFRRKIATTCCYAITADMLNSIDLRWVDHCVAIQINKWTRPKIDERTQIFKENWVIIQ
uniref:Uncharacterized protein n=1 Tax=Acrobeloides nanus TaxID=290746 RepID=A0A914DXH8_9BILA